MWRIGGHVLIERIGERLGEFMHYPFQMSHPGTERPSPETVEQFAVNAAMEFLGVLADTGDQHRFDYGMPAQVVVVFETFHF